MICPFCASEKIKVVDSRPCDMQTAIRRRRECLECKKRFTTYERIEGSPKLTVVKKDLSRDPFNAEKILDGVKAACGKRAIPEAQKMALVDEVEEELHREFDSEAPSSAIAERVMAKLRAIDEVAYIRYASEYYQFTDVQQMLDELNDLRARPKEAPDQQRLFEGGSAGAANNTGAP